MIRWIVIALAVFIVYKLFANESKHRALRNKEQSRKDAERKREAGELVKDPLCGTYVSKEESVSVRDGDTVYRFCSYECRDAFLKQMGIAVPGESRKGDPRH